MEVKAWHFVEFGEFPVEEIDVDEVKDNALALLRRAKVERYETPHGTVLKLMDSYGNYIGKVVGGCSLDKLTIGSAYQTPFGIKVTLDCGETIVGWLYLEG
ncbi:hypothetical protein E3E35_07525 [Thermococcus sp. GR7]|uniref:hypothetical protein n=1 Tax=unclassified Thermococcus TaxID=2627626 RepID=UPI001431AA29|nr:MULTISPECIES: hypothetical protein [unclassified Thermococcus]NJE47250.1 hypothetical protein [Thermococcus sp. GR7]NJE79043.1 hypothetical protein [Thermococcus sp. GR4]NJF22653.1 hypothetical protein [Thermococcus sp. GR5]